MTGSDHGQLDEIIILPGTQPPIGHLPLELISLIASHLEKLDISPEPHSKRWETPFKSLVHLGYGSQGPLSPYDQSAYMNWLLHTEASKSDICSFRLVCHKFNNACYKSFGCILADRRIRVTKTGMEHLTAMGNNPQLTPYIRTLSFGAAQFLPWSHKTITDLFGSLDSATKWRLLMAYKECSDWHTSPGTDANNHLANLKLFKQLKLVFRTLNNLQAVRIVHQDTPTQHLGGWLNCEEDKKLVDELLAGRFTQGGIGSLYTDGNSRLAFNLLFAALKHTSGIELRDFRLSGGRVHNFHLRQAFNYMMPAFENLKTLKMPVTRTHLIRKTSGQLPTVAKFIQSARELEDLELVIENGLLRISQRAQVANYLNRSLEFTAQVFSILSSHNHLRRIVFSRSWAFHENELIAFIEQHKTSLQEIIFKYPYLATGTWLSVLDRISKIQGPKLEFLGLKRPSERDMQSGNWVSVHGISIQGGIRTQMVRYLKIYKERYGQ